jgi:ribonuclease-3
VETGANAPERAPLATAAPLALIRAAHVALDRPAEKPADKAPDKLRTVERADTPPQTDRHAHRSRDAAAGAAEPPALSGDNTAEAGAAAAVPVRAADASH